MPSSALQEGGRSQGDDLRRADALKQANQKLETLILERTGSLVESQICCAPPWTTWIKDWCSLIRAKQCACTIRVRLNCSICRQKSYMRALHLVISVRSRMDVAISRSCLHLRSSQSARATRVYFRSSTIGPGRTVRPWRCGGFN